MNKKLIFALFVWLISRTFLTSEQYFSLPTNQPTVLSVMAYQLSEQGNCENHCAFQMLQKQV